MVVEPGFKILQLEQRSPDNCPLPSMIFSVWLINRAGGLIYHRAWEYGPAKHPKLLANDLLVVASTLQSVHAISARVSPLAGSSGLQMIEYPDGGFRLYCHQVLTGLKVIAIVDAGQNNVDVLIRRIHEVFSDYALKNPFYRPEMPVRSDLFEFHLARLVRQLATP